MRLKHDMRYIYIEAFISLRFFGNITLRFYTYEPFTVDPHNMLILHL